MFTGLAPWSLSQPPIVMIAISSAETTSRKATIALVCLDSGRSRLG